MRRFFQSKWMYQIKNWQRMVDKNYFDKNRHYLRNAYSYCTSHTNFHQVAKYSILAILLYGHSSLLIRFPVWFILKICDWKEQVEKGFRLY